MLTPGDRVVMLSGANRGIGAAIAQRLAGEGYRLSLGMRDRAKSKLAPSDRVMVARYDADDADAATQWVTATVERYGRIDAVINNAGISRAYSVEAGDEADLDAMWQVNVKAPLRVVRAALPYLKQCGTGRVVQMASLSGKRLFKDNHGYAMTKFATVALAHAVRRMGWEHGIRATALCPGMVNTDMIRANVDRAALTQPEDLAEVVSLLLRLPNTASVAELLVNGRLEDMV